MNSSTMALKDSRIDLRMTRDQKSQIERAARINGISLSQWALSHLLESARKDIAESESLIMSAKAFDQFEKMLDEAVDPRFEEFSQGSTRWDR